MEDLIVIKPEHPFSGKELFLFAACLGAAAWIVPLAVDFGLANVPSLGYRGSGVETAVNSLGRPVLTGIGAAVIGFCAPTRGWFTAPAVALGDVFLWVVGIALAISAANVDRIEALGPPLLRILALTMLPAAVTGGIVYIVRD